MLTAASIMSCTGPPAPSPNIVFILVDDLGWKDLGCYGSDFYQTPHIDRLASEGVSFSDAYAACPVCSPTRAAIMTGKHPARLNITDWIPGDDPRDRKLLGTPDGNELALDEITLAEVFRAQGYKTFFAGKWHLGGEGYFPEDQGFDINLGGHHRGSPPGGYYVPYDNPKLPDGPEGEYLTDRLTAESIKFISENKSTPFLLFLSFYTVHTPIQPNKEFVGLYHDRLEQMGNPESRRTGEHHAFTTENQVNAGYASMVHALDNNIGRLLNSIDEAGLTDNTIIVFTSDNGGLTTIEYINWIAPTSVRPLRAGKGWCYEGGIRVPLIIKAPWIKPGKMIEPVISMDLFPTLLEMAGIEESPGQQADGSSLTGLLSGHAALDRDALFWHYPHYHTSGWTPGSAIRMGGWKLIEYFEDGTLELYNLADDISENHNLADSLPGITKKMKNRLDALRQETGALVPSPNPEYHSN